MRHELSRAARVGPRPYRPEAPTGVVRITVDRDRGAEISRLALAPGEQLIVENATGRFLTVAPLDFFGNSFDLAVIEPGRASAPLLVQGLWFQVDLRAEDGRVYPLDVYLAPNAVEE